jgi:cbb3-type cytochrome oxidase maturation protein
MSIIYVLIPLAIIIVGIGVIIFFWAVRSNQFEDLDRQGYSILFDDDISKESVNIVETKDKADNAEDRK